MGPERLTRLVALAAVAVVAVVAPSGAAVTALSGCGPRSTTIPERPQSTTAAAGTGGVAGGSRHAQVFRARTVDERLALLDALRKRSGPAWQLGKAGPALEDVEPIRPFLRRAWRVDSASPPRDFDAPAAEAEAIAFVTANAAVLGLSAGDVPLLDIRTVRVPPDGTRHAFATRFEGKLPMRGFESFESVVSTIDVVVFVDDDRQVRFFANLSRIHPRLAMDTRPRLDAEDPKVLKDVVGRELYFAEADPRNPGARVRELRRQSLGKVASSDVVGRTLTIWISPGPMGAYVAYHLAYRVDVGRGGHWFRFMVSADTGDLLDDAKVPVVGAGPPEPED